MSHLDVFMNLHGEKITIERAGKEIATVMGLHNSDKKTGKPKFNFYPDVDVKPGDWIIRQLSGDRYYVKDTEAVIIEKKFEGIDAYCQTAAEYARSQNPEPSVFNIQNAYGSVIGTGNTATINYGASLSDIRNAIELSNSEDKEEMQKIIDLLEMIIKDQVPAQKGILSRFSAVMERNSWITNSIAGALMGWLTNQIPQF